MNTVKTGRFLALLRKEAGLTQEELGCELGVTNKTVSRWENGNYMPDIEMFAILSEKYGVSINELLSGERLEGEKFKTEADENVRDAYRETGKKIRRAVVIAVSGVIALCLVFVCTGFAFEYKDLMDQQKRRLYPAGTNDVYDAKTVMEDIVITHRDPGNAEIYEADGCTVTFDLPEGYKKYTSGDISALYSGDAGRFIVIRTVKQSMPFLLPGIKSFPELMKYAYSYDLSTVTPKSGYEEIELAGNVRKLRSYYGIANISKEAEGRFYLLKNGLNGYLISAAADPDADYTLWLLYFESGFNGIYVTFRRSAENSSLTEITDWISTFSIS